MRCAGHPDPPQPSFSLPALAKITIRMTLAEIIALASVVISIGTNVGLYVHLSSVMHTRFHSVERRLELVQGSLHEVDVRLTKLER